MERTIKLRLRQKNGEFKEYFQDFIPQSKRLEYIRLEAELESRKDENGEPILPTKVDYEELQAEFVAGLFADKEVTKKAILDGLDTLDQNVVFEIIRYRVLGFSKEEDELQKKAMMAELLGENFTTSK